MRDTDRRIADAIRAIELSLEPSRWTDGNHLDATSGQKVFEDERKAAQHLEGIKSRRAQLAGWIGSLVMIDRELAETAIAESTDPRAIAKAQSDLVKGDAAAAAGKARDAIDHYAEAWGRVTP